MPLPALSLWPGRQPYRSRIVDGRRGDGPSSVRSRLSDRQQSQSSPDPAGKDSATPSPMLTEAGTSVRMSFQSRSLLLLADESSGVTVRMKLFRDFNLLAAGRWWNSWCLASVVCRVRSMRQATVNSWCEKGRYRPVGVHCPSSLVWGSPRWFGSSRVGPGSDCVCV